MRRLRIRQRREHRSNPAKVDPWYADTNSQRCENHQQILEDADPRDRPNAAGKYKSRDERDSNDHGRRAADALCARDLHDDSQSGQLELKVRNDENNSDDGNEGDQVSAAVPPPKEVRLGLQSVLAS